LFILSKVEFIEGHLVIPAKAGIQVFAFCYLYLSRVLAVLRSSQQVDMLASRFIGVRISDFPTLGRFPLE
jgi:hypothetical protein